MEKYLKGGLKNGKINSVLNVNGAQLILQIISLLNKPEQVPITYLYINYSVNYSINYSDSYC